jgi:hypothetical protein
VSDRVTRWLLLTASEDGNPICWLSPHRLDLLLDDPTHYGVERFVDPNDITPDPNYWNRGEGILLRVEVVIPIPAGVYKLPEGLDV